MIDVRDESRRGSIVKLAAAGYLGSALAIVTGPLVARALGPAGRGEVAAATVYAMIATLVLGLGFPTAVSYAAATRAHPSGAVLNASIRFALLLIAPVLVTAAIIVAWPLSELSTGGRAWAGVLIALVPLGVLGNCLNSMLVAEGALGPITRLRLVPLLLTAVATVVAFVLGVLTVVVALAISAAAVIVTAVLSWKFLHVRPEGRAPLPWLVRFGLRGYVGSLAVFATHMVDQAFLLTMLGSRPLGWYAVAVTISSVPNSIGLAIYSRYFTPVAEEHDPDARGELMSRALRLTLVASAAVSGAVAAASPLLLPLLYGDAFARSVTPLLLLLPGTVVFCVSMVGETFLTAVGRPGRVTFAELTGFVVTLVGLPIVIPRWGIVGTALLSTASYTVVLVACLLFLRQVAPVSLRPRRGDVDVLAVLARNAVRNVFRAVVRWPDRERSAKVRRTDGE